MSDQTEDISVRNQMVLYIIDTIIYTIFVFYETFFKKAKIIEAVRMNILY
jgi:hypothetical protein